jgi:hypothetical protein
VSTRLLAAALIALTVAAPTTSAPAAARPARIYAALIGRWAGSLEYKDYRDPRRRVTLPTRLDVRIAPDSASLALRFTYDDGPGKTVYGDDVFTMDTEGTMVAWGSTKDEPRQAYVVQSLSADSAGRTFRLLLEGEGEDDDAPATIRQTITVERAELRITKETRPSGGAFGFRHEYRFRRAD